MIYYLGIKKRGDDFIKITKYKLSPKGFTKHLKMALVSDLHAENPSRVIELLKRERLDYILMAGDIVEALDGSFDEKNSMAFGIFKACADIAPTFYCTGNHEDGGVHSQSKKWRNGEGRSRIYTDKNIKSIQSSGVHMLIDSYKITDGIAFGGLASGLIMKNATPSLDFLAEFSRLPQPKVLICHHPEYYEPYIRELPIDIIVSGHAHGGQWRLFGRGIFAPGQGLFPKYTSGVHDGRLIVSRGLKNSYPIPRLFNPRELVIIEI